MPWDEDGMMEGEEFGEGEFGTEDEDDDEEGFADPGECN